MSDFGLSVQAKVLGAEWLCVSGVEVAPEVTVCAQVWRPARGRLGDSLVGCASVQGGYI